MSAQIRFILKEVKHVVVAFLILYLVFTLLLLFGFDANEKNKRYLATKVEEYAIIVNRKENLPIKVYSTSIIDEHAATKFEIETQIPAPPTLNEENILTTIPYEMIHATPPPFQQYGRKNSVLNHFDGIVSKTDNINREEKSTDSTFEIEISDKIDMAYATSGASNDDHQYGFLTPVILPETTLHFPPMIN